MAIELGRGAKCMRVLFILLNIPILVSAHILSGLPNPCQLAIFSFPSLHHSHLHPYIYIYIPKLTGFAIVGVGISLYPSSNNSGSVSCVNYKNGAAILIALGLFTALLSVLGVLAAVFTLRSLLGVVSCQHA